MPGFVINLYLVILCYINSPYDEWNTVFTEHNLRIVFLLAKHIYRKLRQKLGKAIAKKGMKL
jgi:hypothetical protein